MFLAAAFVIFSIGLLAAGYYVWSVPRQEEADTVTARLRDLRTRSGARSHSSPDLIRREDKGKFGFLGEFFDWLGIQRRLGDYLAQANLRYRPADVIVFTVTLGVVSFLLLGLLGMTMLFLRLVISVAVAAIPVFLILRVRRRRLAKFEELFPDAIDLFNRSLKAGHTIHSGLETLAQETIDPVRMEFKKVIEELSLGSQVDQALLNLGRRVPLVDLKFFITGLILQRQTGANMMDVLDNLSLLVRERLNMAAKMRAHTAQQRLSAGLLCALPVVVGFGFWIVKPEYINLLVTDPTGSMFFTYAIVSELVGILIIRKLANPRF